MRQKPRTLPFLFLIMLTISFSNTHFNQKMFIERQSFLKNSGYWTLNSIFIDDEDPSNNWLITAATQPWCRGSGTWTDPYIIENVTINCLGGDTAIYIRRSYVYFIVRNCTVYNYNIAGIFVEYTNNGQLFNNTVYMGNGNGIYIQDSSNNSISQNIVFDNGYAGIKLDCDYNNSNYNKIINNVIFDNGEAGFYLDGSFNEHILDVNHNNFYQNIVKYNKYGIYSIFADFNNFTENYFINNSLSGIYLKNGDFHNIRRNTAVNNTEEAICINQADNCTIRDNIFRNNGYGIRLYGHNDDTLVYNNNLTKNRFYGIVLGDNDVNDNILFNNTLINNSVNALDSGTNTQWSLHKRGNYWSDYTGIDVDDDGIGDLPYDMPPAGGNMDNHPIFEDGNDVGPNITINLPYEYAVFGVGAPYYDITVFDLYGFHTVWYTIDEGITNYTINKFSDWINQSAWDLKSTEQVIVKFFANDTNGLLGSNEVSVFKDLDVPSINILNPTPNQILGIKPPNFTVKVNDEHLDTMWYSLNYGNDIIFTTNSTFNELEWSAVDNGSVHISFYANDSAGNIYHETTTAWKDAYQPEITINSPLLGDIFGNQPPSFNVFIYDQHLESMWYSLNRLSNYTFYQNGTIDETLWKSIQDDLITFIVYANDTAGNIGYEGIFLRKDMVAPDITIQSPRTNDRFRGLAPVYGLSVLDNFYVDTIWYTMDNGQTNITLSSLSGVLSQEEWELLPEGHITIIFYANDTVGNVGFNEVVIIKEISIPEPSNLFSNPLFYIFTISSTVLGIIILYLYKKKSEKK